jgi:hypothetical protein
VKYNHHLLRSRSRACGKPEATATEDEHEPSPIFCGEEYKEKRKGFSFVWIQCSAGVAVGCGHCGRKGYGTSQHSCQFHELISAIPMFFNQ